MQQNRLIHFSAIALGILALAAPGMAPQAHAVEGSDYYAEGYRPIFNPYPTDVGRGGKRSWRIRYFGPVGIGMDLQRPGMTMQITNVEEGSPADKTGKLSEGPYAGRYIYWFHNNRTPGWNGRNPAYLLGGVEVDAPDGKRIQWGEPVAVLYHQDPKTRISYPDFIWDDGLHITQTQKSIARVHPIPDALLKKLWPAL